MSDDFTKVFSETLSELNLEDKLETTEEVEETQEDITYEPVEEDTEDTEDTDEYDDDSETDDEDDDEEESDDSDENTDDSVITLKEDDVIRLPDGSEVSVKEAALRQADYTKKTQALAEKTKELEAKAEEYTQLETYVNSLRDAWTSDPAEVVANFIISASEPTTVLAKALVNVAKQGKLDPKFLQQFGITEEVQSKWAEESKTSSELNDVKNRLAQVEAERQQQATTQAELARQEELVNYIEEQWNSVKAKHGINLGPKEELDAKVQLLEYAASKNILDLEVAYAALQFENKNKPAKKTSSKKTTGAVSKTSGAKQVVKKKPVESVEDALWETFNEISSKSK